MKYEYNKELKFSNHSYNYDEYCNYVLENSKINPEAGEDSFKRIESGNEEEFFGVHSLEQLKQLAYNGWPEGRKKCSEIKDILVEKIMNQVEIINCSYDLEGNEIDVAKYVENEPECWIRFDNVIKNVLINNKLIHIVAELGVSSGISEEVINQRGASILSLIEILELSGFRVKLTIKRTSCSTISQTRSTLYSSIGILMKDYNDTLDMNRLSFVLLHQGFCRAMYFRSVECFNQPELHWLMSTSHKYYPGNSPILEGDIRFMRMLGNDDSWSTVEGCKERIIQQMEKFGIKIRDKETK